MENEKNAVFQISQKAIIYDKQTQKFLIAKQSHLEYTFTKKFGPWDFFGGRINEGEVNLVESVQREILEESSLNSCEILEVVDTYIAENRAGSLMIVGYLASYQGGDVILSEEHSEYAWVTAEEVAENKVYHAWLKQFIATAQKRMTEVAYLPDLQRLQADFSNYKKRQQESQKELAGYLIEKLVMDITPVLDNFQMATNHVPADAANSPWVTGIQYIEKQLEKVLTDNGMQILEAKEGDVFNPSLHEAISEEEKVVAEGEDAPTENEAPQQQTIAKVLQKGYKIGEKVIRPTKVVVR